MRRGCLGERLRGAAASQGSPRVTGSHRNLGRAKDTASPRAFRGPAALAMPLLQTHGPRNCTSINACRFGLPSPWSCVTAAQGNECRSKGRFFK